MGVALQDFQNRVQMLRSDIAFLERAFTLRPRIFEVLDLARQGEVMDVATRFGTYAGNEPELLCGPLLVRLVASFERYLRALLRETVESWANRAKSFDKLPEGLAERNLVLSGRVIGSIDSPRDHLTIDIVSLVDNLATCRGNTTAYRLNSGVFMELIYGVTPEIIEKALKAVRITNWENAVAADKALQAKLGATRTVDAAKEVTQRLKKISRWRNNWAHGGDEEVSLTFRELNDEVDFLTALSNALNTAVSRQIASANIR